MSTYDARTVLVTDTQEINGWIRLGGYEGRSTHVRLNAVTAWASDPRADLIRIWVDRLQYDVRPDNTHAEAGSDPLDDVFELLVSNLLELDAPGPDRGATRSAVT